MHCLPNSDKAAEPLQTEQAGRIFIWSDYRNWTATILKLVQHSVPGGDYKAILLDPRGYFETMRPAGLGNATERFHQVYSSIRMFHACRTDDVESYLLEGLRPLDTKHQLGRAKALFLTNQFPKLREEDLLKETNELATQGRENRLCLVADDANLISYAGHYLIYGSEFLAALSSRLDSYKGTDCLSFLRTIGIPTMFVCDIPISSVPEPQLANFLVELIVRAVETPAYVAGDIPSIDFTFTFNHSIPARFIVSHYHPTRIYDRLLGGVYIPDRQSYLCCSNGVNGQ